MAKKIIGLKKAIGDYKRANAGGDYSAIYGCLMYDVETGELWTDEFCSIGHNSWKDYPHNKVVNLGRIMRERGINNICMASVKQFLADVDVAAIYYPEAD